MAENQIDTAYHLNGGLSAEEFERLEFQHNVLVAITGKLLPPKILSTLSASARIADIGTGTGIWLQDMASLLQNSHPNEMPETEACFVGFDIDINKFPTRESLGPDIILEEHDVTRPFKREYFQSFDLVHVRLMLFALPTAVWSAAVRNLRDLVKPGGWLFVEETGYSTFVTLPPSRMYTRWLELDMEFATSKGRSLTSPEHVPSLLAAADIAQIESKDHSTFAVPHQYKNFNLCMYRLIAQSCRGVLAAGGQDGLRTEEDAQAIIDGVKADIVDGPYVSGVNLKWFWGKVPLDGESVTQTSELAITDIQAFY